MKTPTTFTPVGLALVASLSISLQATLFSPRLQARQSTTQNAGDPGQEVGGGGPGLHYPVKRIHVFVPSEVTKKANITFKPDPPYTEEARQDNVEGTVRLRAVLTASGEITDISVIKGLPGGLMEKAVAAAKQIKFTPAEKDGHVVWQYVVLEYYFHIPYKEDEVSKRVVILEKPAPEYTEEARRNNTNGKVVLKVLFASYGRVILKSVEQGLPDGLTEKAVRAAFNIKFTPAQINGRNVTQYGTVEYDFTP